MKSVLIAKGVGILFLLSACADQTLVPPLSESAFTTIAKDASEQLATLYPPALTHLVLKADAGTLFDNRFKSQLRHCGYALDEIKEDAAAIPKSGGKQLSYVLDALTNVAQYGYYRLTLNIGDEQLSRLYDANNLSKPNYWSYRK